MPVFDYTASDRTGALTKGELEASDKTSATKLLTSKGLFVLEVKPSARPALSSTASEQPAPLAKEPGRAEPVASTLQNSGRPVVASAGRDEPAAKKSRGLLSGARWPALQQALYLRQLNVMFAAGIPIHRAAELVGESEDNPPKVRRLLCEIPRDLERGRMLSKSLEKSGLFGRLVVSSVKLGEESGRLDRVLGELADAKEESVRLRRTLVSRLTYPTVVLISMSLGLVVMGHVMSQVMSSLPNFKPEDVPLFGMVNKILGSTAFLPAVLALMAATLFLLRYVSRNLTLRVAAERRIFAVPVLGGVLRRLEASTVTRQLSLLLSAGLPIDRGMELCAELVTSECFRQALLTSQKSLREGAELTECFRDAELFPDDVMALITAGEVSGKLEESLKRSADYCADQVERSLETLLALIEPLMIGFLGVTIGVVLLCTFVPVFNSLQTM